MAILKTIKLMRYVQNKKKKKRVWSRGVADSGAESQSGDGDGLGQLMLYLTAAHFTTLARSKTKPSPILGLYMKDLKVCFA